MKSSSSHGYSPGVGQLVNGSMHGSSTHGSSHGFSISGGSSHGLGPGVVIKIRSVLIDVGDDEVIADDDFEDSRMELRHAGHNLVSEKGEAMGV